MVRCVQEPSLPCPYKCEIWEVEWADMSEEGGPFTCVESDDSVKRVNFNASDHGSVVSGTCEIIGNNVLDELLATAASDGQSLVPWGGYVRYAPRALSTGLEGVCTR